MLVGKGEAVFHCVRNLVERQDERFFVLPVGHRQLRAGHFPPDAVPAKGRYFDGYARCIAEGVVQYLYGRHLQAAEGRVGPKTDAICASDLFRDTLFSLEKGRPGGIAPDVFQFQGFPRIPFRSGEGQNTDVLIVPPFLLRWLSFGKHDIRSATRYVGAAPDEIPHRILGLHPRAAGHRPAGAGLDGEPEIQAPGLFSQEGNHPVPIFGKRNDGLVHARPPASEGTVEPLYAGNPGPGDRLQVRLHPFAGHVVPDKMEPGMRPEILGRDGEILLVLRPERRVQNGLVGLNIRDLGPKTKGGQNAERNEEESFHKRSMVMVSLSQSTENPFLPTRADVSDSRVMSFAAKSAAAAPSGAVGWMK